jgi:hypothetical protein
MNAERNDAETLKQDEEADPEWVNLWDDCKNKKESSTKQLTFDSIDI